METNEGSAATGAPGREPQITPQRLKAQRRGELAHQSAVNSWESQIEGPPRSCEKHGSRRRHPVIPHRPARTHAQALEQKRTGHMPLNAADPPRRASLSLWLFMFTLLGCAGLVAAILGSLHTGLSGDWLTADVLLGGEIYLATVGITDVSCATSVARRSMACHSYASRRVSTRCGANWMPSAQKPRRYSHWPSCRLSWQ